MVILEQIDQSKTIPNCFQVVVRLDFGIKESLIFFRLILGREILLSSDSLLESSSFVIIGAFLLLKVFLIFLFGCKFFLPFCLRLDTFCKILASSSVLSVSL